jgi:hypothetical protein
MTAEFVTEVTDGLLPPAYFGMNVAMNKKGYDIESVLNNGMQAIKVTDFEAIVENTEL